MLRRRATSDARCLSVPFEGKWFLVNAAMGYAGHVGIHAYDFAITDRQLQRARVRGSTNNSDYLSFGRPILNPVEGIVSRTESIQPDGTPLEKVRRRSMDSICRKLGDPRKRPCRSTCWAPDCSLDSACHRQSSIGSRAWLNPVVTSRKLLRGWQHEWMNVNWSTRLARLY